MVTGSLSALVDTRGVNIRDVKFQHWDPLFPNGPIRNPFMVTGSLFHPASGLVLAKSPTKGSSSTSADAAQTQQGRWRRQCHCRGRAEHRGSRHVDMAPQRWTIILCRQADVGNVWVLALWSLRIRALWTLQNGSGGRLYSRWLAAGSTSRSLVSSPATWETLPAFHPDFVDCTVVVFWIRRSVTSYQKLMIG